MRFAPPPAVRVADRGGGLNQTSVRTHNERLVMSLLRQHGQLSRMELGIMSGLSAQTISVIVRALERDNLILRGEAQRGRVGPPSIPMELNPDGAFAIGVKIGRRSTDTVLVDFVGRVRAHRETLHDEPQPAEVLVELQTGIPAMRAAIPAAFGDRFAGVGISLPEDIESWSAEAAPGAAVAWAEIDFESHASRLSGTPTLIQNDVTAAAGAESIFGVARKLGDFVYFFIGAQSASRLVLDHRIYAARRGDDPAGEASTLPALADLIGQLRGEGYDEAALWRDMTAWPAASPSITAWSEASAARLAAALRALFAFVHVDTVVVDGRMPEAVKADLCGRLQALAGTAATTTILSGHVGALAKAVGAASLPFHARFMVESIGLAADPPNG
jgi:predicted NBD/HSP70 family sugar kinase